VHDASAEVQVSGHDSELGHPDAEEHEERVEADQTEDEAVEEGDEREARAGSLAVNVAVFDQVKVLLDELLLHIFVVDAKGTGILLHVSGVILDPFLTCHGQIVRPLGGRPAVFVARVEAFLKVLLRDVIVRNHTPRNIVDVGYWTVRTDSFSPVDLR